MTATTGPASVGIPLTGDALATARPPGDRYFRHPGDVVRLVVWGVAAVLLVLLLRLGKETSQGVTEDLGRAASSIPDAVREFALALAQVGALLVPAVIVALLVWQRRWRRLALVIAGAAAGVIAFVLVDLYLDLPGRLEDAVSTSTWVTSTRFPSLAYVAGAAGATMVGKPWLSRSYRRASDSAIAALVLIVAIAGTAGVVRSCSQCPSGSSGARRSSSPSEPRTGDPRQPRSSRCSETRASTSSRLTLRRAEGGRAQLYDVDEPSGRKLFVKVYDRDSRDADLLYRGYRTALYRGPNEQFMSGSLDRDVEHEALMLLVARRAGVRSPALEVMTALPDGSLALALEEVTGPVMADLDVEAIDDALLDETWKQVDTLHRSRIAHRALHPSNILVHDGKPVVVDFAAAESSAAPRLLAIDRAELLASLAADVGVARAIDSAMRVLEPDDVAAAMPYLQPLGAVRVDSKARAEVALAGAAHGHRRRHRDRGGAGRAARAGQGSHARHDRRPDRRVLRAASQLAHVGDSFTALRTANFAWLIVALVMSGLTYVASAIGLLGGVPNHLPMIPTIETQMASSFVNRVTPANVGGMALNVRFMQKAGVDPADAVTGMGLNVVAGAIVHIVLLFVFFAWAGKGDCEASRSRRAASARHHRGGAGGRRHRRGRRAVVESSCARTCSASSGSRPGHRDARSVAEQARLLFGGSLGVTLAYIGALAASCGRLSRGSRASPRSGRCTSGHRSSLPRRRHRAGSARWRPRSSPASPASGWSPGVAVAVVLSYRLLTYWLPILPGWISFHVLERRNLI